MANPIDELMGTGMEQLRDMMDVNTVVGDMMVTESGVIVMPVSRVSIGFVCGGAEYSANRPLKRAGEQLEKDEGSKLPLAGGTAAGMSLTPTAFLSILDGDVRITPVQYDNTLDRLVQLIPTGLDSLCKLLEGLTGGASEPATKEEK